MTVEEAKVKYGDPTNRYYVFCAKCPLDDNADCICRCTDDDCLGYGDVWKRIADHFNKENNLTEEDMGKKAAEYIDKALGLNDDYRCHTCANGVFGKTHPTCVACIDDNYDGDTCNYLEQSCFNCKFFDKDLDEELCVNCEYGDSKNDKLLWVSPHYVTEPPTPTETDETDNVHHPSHYNQGGIECIDAMVSAFGKESVKHFCICNAFKYVWRAEHKNGIEDVDKAIWYLNKVKELAADE